MDILEGFQAQPFSVAAVVTGAALWSISFGISFGFVGIDEKVHPHARTFARILGTILLFVAISVEAARWDLNQQKSENEQLKEYITGVEADSTRARSELEKARSTVSGLTAQLDTAEDEVERLKNEVSQLTEENENKVDQKEIANLQSKIEVQRILIANLRDEHNASKSLNAAHSTEVGRLTKQLGEIATEEFNRTMKDTQSITEGTPSAKTDEEEPGTRECRNFQDSFGTFEFKEGDSWIGFANNIRLYVDRIGPYRISETEVRDGVFFKSNEKKFEGVLVKGMQIERVFENCKYFLFVKDIFDPSFVAAIVAKAVVEIGPIQ